MLYLVSLITLALLFRDFTHIINFLFLIDQSMQDAPVYQIRFLMHIKWYDKKENIQKSYI